MKKLCFGAILVFFILDKSFAEKIYLDITQPHIKKLTVAVEGFENASIVFRMIKENLEFTEYFRVYGPFPLRDEKFDSSLWRNSDVEIVIKAKTEEKILLEIYAVTSDTPIFTKEYALKNDESTGNLIASEIYRILTGKDSPFFNRFVFLRKFKNSTGIFISNWSGKNIFDTGIRREIISKAILKGNKIFYSALQGKLWHIEVFDLSSKENREIIKSKALLQLGDVINEHQFIYIQNDGELSEIKISDLLGKGRTIISSRWVESSPRWHDSQILFVSNKGGSPQIYQTKEGTSSRRVTFQGKYNTEPTISPDGKKVAFSSFIEGFQIHILDLISGVQTQITKEGNNEQPSFCPDGHFLTIMSDRRGRKEIYLVSVDGLIQKPLTTGYLPYCTK
ncbi:MAG: hypothetical protein NZ809_03600 [Thermodesulfovibrio sp.]|nr:hypothetical protein [Thermodesulfovibrio sp.]